LTQEVIMGIGAGVLLIAVGAVLYFAVDATIVDQVNLDTVGIILMVVGTIAIVLSLFVFESWRSVSRDRRDVY
jgi:hypothetical protein